jgi:homocysteine S-methyltransferase
MYERMRRDPAVEMDPDIVNSALIYHPRGASILAGAHREYLDIASRSGVPMLAFTDTWRANQERVERSRWRDREVNQDNALFMRDLLTQYGETASIYLGGTIGPRGDAYTPEQALHASEARAFHRPQVEALSDGGVDFIYVATLPAISEALGIALLAQDLNLASIISFVVRADGSLLDGTPLARAITELDETAPPTGYGVNCVYPTVLMSALAVLRREAPDRLERIVSYQANTSPKDPKELDGSLELETEAPDVLAMLMLDAYQSFGIPIMGGCCGTDAGHISRLCESHLKTRPPL